MVSCGQYKMIPMAPSSMMAMPPSSKPKIGFSIDSIVGKSEHHAAAISGLSPGSECGSERPSSPMSDCSYPLELRNDNIQRQNVRQTECTMDITENRLNRIQQFMSNSDFHNRNFATKCQPESPTNHQDCKNQKHSSMCSNSPPPRHTRLTPDDVSNRKLQRTPSPPSVAHLQSNTKGPIVVPGIPAGLVRPFPVQPPNMNEIKQIPPYINASEMIGPPNPHFLAAQFQMAAALAHGQTGQGFPPGAGLPQHHPQFGNPNMVRESYPLYPWLLSRHGRIFPHRFPGNFLLQPFRKPKRVRTAFSPSQLLKLEHAFEGNHYVVGAERKTLAQALSLTETQVKVWFQNRRTKHKRMQQEEDAKGNGPNGCNSNNNNNNNNSNNNSQNSQGDENAESQMSCDEDEDELIDMEDCPSDEENDLVP